MAEENTYYVTVPRSNDSNTAVISDAAKEVEELTHNSFLGEIMGSILREAMKSGTPIDRIEKEAVVDGVYWKCKVISEKKGGYVLAFKKITDPDELGRRQIQELAVKMIKYLCHDFRNYLAAINGCAGLLQMRYHIPDSDLDGIFGPSHQGEKCISAYEGLCKDPDPRLVPVDVNESLDNIVRVTSKHYKNVEIVRNYTENLPQINASDGLLGRLWHNLLSNACESTEGTGRPGRVVISTGMYGSDLVKVCFEDNGSGMNQTTLAAWKSTSSSIKPFSTKEKGKGEGRSIIMDVMKKNKAAGHSVESREGKGTKISVYFNPVYE